jgi:hypothetical protein
MKGKRGFDRYGTIRIFKAGYRDAKSPLPLKKPPPEEQPYASGWAAGEEGMDMLGALNLYLKSVGMDAEPYRPAHYMPLPTITKGRKS